MQRLATNDSQEQERKNRKTVHKETRYARAFRRRRLYKGYREALGDAVIKQQVRREYMSKCPPMSVDHAKGCLDSKVRNMTLTMSAIGAAVTHGASVHGLFHVGLVVASVVAILRRRGIWTGTLGQSVIEMLRVESTGE